MDPLKLAALDAEDLAVISAHLQDSVLKVGDMAWRPGERRFAMVVNRYDWSSAAAGLHRRRRAGLRFDRVTRVQASQLRRDAPEAVLNLLAVTFEPGDEPSGVVTLVFSGGGALRLVVECLECELRDLGPVWETASRPRHDAD